MVTVTLNQVECIYVVICYLPLAEDQDFTLIRNAVTFAIGANDGNTISILVDVLDDLLVEGTECFTLSGAISTTTAAPGSTFVGGTVTICIADNDCKFVYGCSWSLTALVVKMGSYRLTTSSSIRIPDFTF